MTLGLFFRTAKHLHPRGASKKSLPLDLNFNVSCLGVWFLVWHSVLEVPVLQTVVLLVDAAWTRRRRRSDLPYDTHV